jgi:hypothetical protein
MVAREILAKLLKTVEAYDAKSAGDEESLMSDILTSTVMFDRSVMTVAQAIQARKSLLDAGLRCNLTERATPRLLGAKGHCNPDKRVPSAVTIPNEDSATG